MKRGLFYFLIIVLAITIHSCNQVSTYKSYIHPEPATLDSNLIIPPAWSFGILYGGYTNQEETIERIKKIQSHDYPIDAYWIDSWFWDYINMGMGPEKYIDFVADTISYPDREAMWTFMEENNIKGGFWIWDCIQKTGNEEAFYDFKERGYFSEVFINTGSWHNASITTDMYREGDETTPRTPTGNVDFNNPEAAEYFKQQIKHFFDEGADFIKLDRNASVEFCRAMFEATQEFGKETQGRGFILSHSHGTEDEEFKRYPTKWTGDSRADWSMDKPTKEFYSWVPKHALKENIESFADPENRKSIIPFLTMDLGGFQMGTTHQKDEELFIRWMQFGIFTPIVQLFSQAENPTSNLPYNYSHRADTLFRYYSHLRMKLFPYIYSYAHQTRLKGENIIRQIPGTIHEYNFGKEFLVAPIYRQGARTRELTFPHGTWIDYWTGEYFDGLTTHVVDAPIDKIPLFVRQGAVIPMRKYATSVERGTNDVLELHVFPGSDSQFTLIEDDGTSNDYLEGIYLKTEISLHHNDHNATLTIEPAKGYYNNMKENREWIFIIHDADDISSIEINGKASEYSVEGSQATTKAFRNSKYNSTEVIISF